MGTARFLWLAFVAACLVAIATPSRAETLWIQNFETASERAKAENRHLLLNFSGSDWCGYCKRLDEEVFNRTEFKSFARSNLVCVLVDFPVKKTQRTRTREQNEALQKKYDVSAFPTIILLSPKGKFLGQTGYRRASAPEFVRELEGMMKK